MGPLKLKEKSRSCISGGRWCARMPLWMDKAVMCNISKCYPDLKLDAWWRQSYKKPKGTASSFSVAKKKNNKKHYMNKNTIRIQTEQRKRCFGTEKAGSIKTRYKRIHLNHTSCYLDTRGSVHEVRGPCGKQDGDSAVQYSRKSETTWTKGLWMRGGVFFLFFLMLGTHSVPKSRRLGLTSKRKQGISQ